MYVVRQNSHGQHIILSTVVVQRQRPLYGSLYGRADEIAAAPLRHVLQQTVSGEPLGQRVHAGRHGAEVLGTIHWLHANSGRAAGDRFM